MFISGDISKAYDVPSKCPSHCYIGNCTSYSRTVKGECLNIILDRSKSVEKSWLTMAVFDIIGKIIQNLPISFSKIILVLTPFGRLHFKDKQFTIQSGSFLSFIFELPILQPPYWIFS